MDELFTVFLIIVFVVLPLLEGVLKKRRGEGEGPPIDPGPPEEPRRPPAEARRTPSGGPRTSEGMIPPDVWEELTGQPAPGGRPAERAPTAERAPAPEPAPERAPTTERAPGPEPAPARVGARRATTEALPGELRTGSLAVAREEIGGARGGEVGRGPGVMKRRPVPAMGSGAYHGRGKGVAPAAHLVAGLRAGASVEELRRAVLYREVLGPPVALRETGPGEDRPG